MFGDTLEHRCAKASPNKPQWAYLRDIAMKSAFQDARIWSKRSQIPLSKSADPEAQSGPLTIYSDKICVAAPNCSKTAFWRFPGPTLRAGPRNAPKRPSGGFLGPLCGLGPEMLQNSFPEASWAHFAVFLTSYLYAPAGPPAWSSRVALPSRGSPVPRVSGGLRRPK